MARRPGTINKYVRAATDANLIAIAPKVPQKIAFLRKSGGSRLAAIPITSALSPANTMSINTIAKNAQRAWSVKSSIIFLKKLWSHLFVYVPGIGRVDDT